MSLQHINAKFFVDGDMPVELEEVINLFHRWVADQSTDEMLIDVADYRHVPKGPSVALVGLEAHYVLDESRGRCGLIYNRVAPLDGTDDDRFNQALQAAAGACRRLEEAFPGLRFSRSEFQLIINDRLVRANQAEAAAEAAIEAFVKNGLGQADATIEFEQDPRCRVGCIVQLTQPLVFENLSVA